MLLASVIGGYTLIGGLGATFYVSYFNTALIFVLILMLVVEVRLLLVYCCFCLFIPRLLRYSTIHSTILKILLVLLSLSLNSLHAGKHQKKRWGTKAVLISLFSAPVRTISNKNKLGWAGDSFSNILVQHQFQKIILVLFRRTGLRNCKHCWQLWHCVL